MLPNSCCNERNCLPRRKKGAEIPPIGRGPGCPEMKVKGKMNLVIERVKSNTTLENYTNICTPSLCHWGLKQILICRCKPTPTLKGHPKEQGNYSTISGILLGQDLSLGLFLPMGLSLAFSEPDFSGLICSVILLFYLNFITGE